MLYVLAVACLVLISIALYDLMQRKHAILRNFPVLGHFRYFLEALGPELRQYIVANNREERPFDRDQRRWIYASSKKEDDYFGFGTDEELEDSPNYIIIKQSAFPLNEALPTEPSYDPTYQIPCAKILGGYRKRRHAFRPKSIVNISAMSFGSLSPRAVEALNKGCKLANCLQNSGEGGLADYHRQGGEMVWQIGTGYFGCRNEDGTFNVEKFKAKLETFPIRAIEIKLSQGAKPGLGGVLPAAKVTEEISRIRLVPMGKDCISPASHSAFKSVDELLDFVENLSDISGLPVGIKSAVGHMAFWEELAKRMRETGKMVDFITVDGGEGGTGAAPLVFTDHVALPFKMGVSRVYKIMAENDLHQKIVFIGSGKLGFPEASLFAFALGCDMINIAREAMLSIGCIQAQKCETNRCPTGVATQSKWLMRGLDPELKSARLANYVTVLRKEILRLSRACGVPHPSLVSSHSIEIINDRFQGKSICELFNYEQDWSVPSDKDIEEITELMQRPRHLGKPAEAPVIKDTAPVPNQS